MSFRGRTILSALAVCLFCVSALAAAAQERLTLIVERGDDFVEIYLGMPASEMVQTFGYTPPGLLRDDGTVHFDDLRQGTFDMGDAMFAAASAEIAGQTVRFESMSMMVHPKEDRLPFETPIDGMIAMAVCTAETPAVPPTLADLHAYAGFIAYTDNPQGPLSLMLPAVSGADDLVVEIRDHTGHRLTAHSEIEVPKGAAIIAIPGALPAADGGGIPGWLLAVEIAIGLSLVAAILIGSRKRRRRTTAA